MALVENPAVEISAAEISSQREASCSQNPPLSLKKKKSANNPGVDVKGARICDSENGKTCHQCRQKMRDFAASCKRLKKDKLCTLRFCRKCLLNRYGENAEEVGKLENWICPKCRGVCNCSFCMKKKGLQPTGILTHIAKSNGFSSVHELLDNKGAKKLEPQSTELKSAISNKGSSASKRSHDKESQPSEKHEAGPKEEGLAKKLKLGKSSVDKEHGNQSHGNVESNPLKCDNNGNMRVDHLKKVRKSKKLAAKAHNKTIREDIVLPQGSPLIEVSGIELLVQDVGAALQFLEFCNSFSEVLDVKKGQPECILRDLTRGRLKRHGTYSTHVEFNIKLLSLMGMDMKKEGDAWLQALKSCIEKSEFNLAELPLNFLDNGSAGYDALEPSTKLKILNFLCDEVLYTEELRNWIDKVAVKFKERRKENKEKVLAAKKKEKLLKQQMKDEIAKAMLLDRERTPVSLAESDSLVSQLQAEADGVHAEVLSSLPLVPKKNQRFDAVRTDYVVRGSDRQILWKLNVYNNRSNIILQELENWQDKWFFYNEEEEKVVEKYISSVRNRGTIKDKDRSDDIEEETKSNLSDNQRSETENVEEGTKSDSCDNRKSKANDVEEGTKSDEFDSCDNRKSKANDVEEGTKSDESDSCGSKDPLPKEEMET
ncbi:uncharacterized protein LOC109829199 isoform X2 [Asparagus officinalis]|uniref:uncharacterized protein LOC109829199 isoform X2 n=1 Tax=Asparagus officinalis TaxID=4686 RepID=UPI00098E7276|nr:uncharacterized protein LOC109829199 isoform X2 [Asparagus officinalis]